MSRATDLRRRMTEAELKIWRRLRNRQVLGCKFRRQHPIGPYIVDFICLKKKLIVEIDGSQHLENEKYDEERTNFLGQKGYRVLRFWNHDVLIDEGNVLEEIAQKLSSSSPRAFH